MSLKEKYFLTICKIYNPKLIITNFDNEIFFYNLNFITGVKTCMIQNGYRAYNQDIFSEFENKNRENFHVNYKFLFGPSIGELYNKYVPGKNIYIGSFKNNFIESRNINRDIKTIAYISQFRVGKEYLPDLDVISFLNKFCNERNLQLNIYLFGSKNIFGKAKKIFKDEILFYEKYTKCKKNLFFRESSLDNYRSLINENLIVNIDSTLGYEMLSRKKKVIFLSFRDSNKKYWGYCPKKSHNFGWPTQYSDTGLFWSNIYKEDVFKEILSSTLNLDSASWEEKINTFVRNIINFDFQNEKLKQLLNNETRKKITLLENK